jgi:hypothetical protein
MKTLTFELKRTHVENSIKALSISGAWRCTYCPIAMAIKDVMLNRKACIEVKPNVVFLVHCPEAGRYDLSEPLIEFVRIFDEMMPSINIESLKSFFGSYTITQEELAA